MDLSYLSGFLDADGCICVAHSKGLSSYGLSVSFGNTNEKVIEVIAQFIKGKCECRERYCLGHRLNMYYTRLTNKRAADLLKRLYFFLIIKKRKAKYALILDYFINLHRKGGIKRVSLEELEIREKLRRIISPNAYQDKLKGRSRYRGKAS